MNKVLNFPTLGVQLKHARQAKKLTLTQAVCALEDHLEIKVSPKTLENWESKTSPGVTLTEAKSAYNAFCKNAEDVAKLGKNLIFGSIPVSVSQEILDLSDHDIEKSFGYKPSFWAKICANSRFLPDEKMRLLEEMMEEKLVQLCAERGLNNT